MIALYLAGLGVVGAVIAVWARALHVPPPAAFGAVSRGWLAPLVVLAAPLGEEALFRGWLTGRPRALWLLAMALVATGLLTLVALHWRETVASL
ncbi:CPBP family glutamic-type intramembrane protease, partial [Enterococcus faecalis]|uniref:CPBP family glutamic-type intramembrane protease n=1 Tax=Enterococcus faecalis TaxID=1351 RepID=UPI00403EFED8